MSKVLSYETRITIGDTNVMGNVYWVNFCKMFGVARELFLFALLPKGLKPTDVLSSLGVVIETADVNMKFLQSAFLGDNLVTNITTRNFGQCSVEVCCEIINQDVADPKDSLLAIGSQRLVFIDTSTGKIAKIPEGLKVAALEYEAIAPPTVLQLNLAGRYFGNI
ncbi:MAG: hotdog domain-containing protein [Candidatus Buchananbacteria bacterium]|nr:hotdog domain-containing protein [Candidatus Buchananbacteria bacterium]